MSERRERNPTVDGRRRCIDCGLDYPDTSEFFRERKYLDGRVVLGARCIECHRANKRRYYYDSRQDDDDTPPGYCPPWTPPARGDRLGYCPAHGWAWSNGAGPQACACGRKFVETVHPARVCESVRA